jgi:uncharacterized membrane protein YjgN (DUF898 family)
MRAVAFAALGCLLGALCAVALVFLLGQIALALDVRLYASEDDQRRNIALTFALTVVLGALGAWLGYRFGKR